MKPTSLLPAERQVGARWSVDTGAVRLGATSLGPLGRASAELLARVGYHLAGWIRSGEAPPREVDPSGHLAAPGAARLTAGHEGPTSSLVCGPRWRNW